MIRQTARAAVPLALLAFVCAQDPGGRPGGPGNGPGGPGGPGGPNNTTLKAVAQFDRDGNGVLDRDERAAAKVWVAENRPARRGRGAGGAGGPPGGGPGGPPGGGPGGRGGPEGDQPIAADAKGRTVHPADVTSYQGRPLFDADIVRTFFLDFPEPDWFQELDAFYRTDVLLPATVTVDGKSYPNVGIGFRGNTSYMMVRGKKKSFDMAFDFVDGKQQLMGVRNLDLLNCNTDASFLREALHSWIGNQFLPTQRVSLVRVVCNGEDFGIYAATQQFDADFLADHFDTKKGDRFKVSPDFSGNGGLRWLGDEPTAYERNYELKSGANPAAWLGLVDLCAVLDKTPVADLPRILPQHLDVDAALWFLAVDNAVADDDGYHSRASDYVLYRDPKGRFHPIARDNNEILLGPRQARGARPGGQPPAGGAGAADGPGGPGGARPAGGPAGGRGGPGEGPRTPLQMAEREDRPLLLRLLEVPEWKARYLANLRAIANSAFATKNIGARIEHWRQAIDAIVAGDAHAPRGYAAFQQAIAAEGGTLATGSLLAVIAERRKAILDDASMLGAWPHVAELTATVAAPQNGKPALHVRCRVSETKIAEVRLHHDRGPFGTFATTALHDDGRHGDDAANDGIYGGWLPEFAAGDTWRYWIEAVADGSGHVDCLPAGGGAMPIRWVVPK